MLYEVFSFSMSWTPVSVSVSVSAHYCVEVHSIQKPLSSLMLQIPFPWGSYSIFYSMQEVELGLFVTCCFLLKVLQWAVLEIMK